MSVAQLPEVIVPNPAFRSKVQEISGERVSDCFQCEKCTNGCPLVFAMDIAPHKIIRSVHLGLKDAVLNSHTIWVCVSCETCTTRCPNNIDIAHVMDSLRQICQREGVKPAQPNIPLFHKIFLASVKRFGRVHEGEMATTYMLKAGGIEELRGMADMGLDMVKTGGLKELFGMAGIGLDMYRKGKLQLLPHFPNRQVKKIFRATETKGN